MNELVLQDNQQVRKSEALVKSRYKLTAVPLKLITTLISCVQAQDTAEQEYIVRASDFIDKSKVKSKNSSNTLKNACEEIMSKPLKIQNGKDWLIANWCSSIEYVNGEGIIKFQISPKLFPYILDLKERYLENELTNILPLKSEYSIRIYEWLRDEYNKARRYGKQPEIIIKLDELRERFDLGKSYLYNKIKVQILEKAKADLAEFCDIKFDWYEGNKIRKKVIDIKIKIYPNDKNIPKEKQLPPYLATYMDYVNHIRDLYKLTGKYFFIGNKDLGSGEKTYYFTIDKNGYMVAMAETGGESISLNKVQIETIFNASYLCSQYSEIYREFIEEKSNFWKLDEENKEYFGVLIYEINQVLKQHDPRQKPMF